MRNGRNSRGGGGRSRHGHDKRGGGGHRGGRGGGGRSRRGNRRNPRMAAESGNKRERIAIESGNLVLIDQFMLANPQFITRLTEVVDAEPSQKDSIVKDFGGTVVALEPGTYRIDRDPFKFLIFIHPEGAEIENADEMTSEASECSGEVFVDTRCLAMIDRELLDDSELLTKYQQLWFSGQDKACRDLLRDNGGAVRYGFQRYGDELLVNRIPDSDVVCLRPDPSKIKALEAETAAVAAE